MFFWVVFGAVVTAFPQQPGPPDRVAGGVTRFFRGDRTLVDGFVRVPHRMLKGVTLGVGGFAAYRVELRVADEQGTTLAEETWTRRVTSGASAIPGAVSLEPDRLQRHVVDQHCASGGAQQTG